MMERGVRVGDCLASRQCFLLYLLANQLQQTRLCYCLLQVLSSQLQVLPAIMVLACPASALQEQQQQGPAAQQVQLPLQHQQTAWAAVTAWGGPGNTLVYAQVAGWV